MIKCGNCGMRVPMAKVCPYCQREHSSWNFVSDDEDGKDPVDAGLAAIGPVLILLIIAMIFIFPQIGPG